MTTAINSLESILAAAVEIDSPVDRDAFVRQACGRDEELRERVLRLIEVHFEAGTFLESPATAGRPTFVPEPPPRESVGSTIGPYKLLEQIGEGGMGVVYMAEQQRPVRRMVALKIIKPGMDTKQVIARFEAERQALALMNHPNIARVLDAGTTEPHDRNQGAGVRNQASGVGDQEAGFSNQESAADLGDAGRNVLSPDSCLPIPGSCRPLTPSVGRPYFVMELVRGIPITDYCDQNRVPLPARLELFAQVCRAVQHAHTNGIIHRDLKPTNVLVTLHDGVPVPKIIDFGIAKATHDRLTDRTLFTQFSQMVGTPMYMSPEQAEMSGLGIDTRSDVYSLGVLLYELLTGTTPFDRETLSKAGYDEVRRMIREDEPPSASARIGTLPADQQTTVSSRRGVDARTLVRQTRGELDWIVMKALEKDRTRRYESASAFAADVERYLRDDPVEACPPSAAYRFRKYARRHKGALTALLAVAVAVLTGTAFSVWQAIEATSARKLADEQRMQASENLQKALDAAEQMLMRVADERLAEVPGAEPVRKELLQEAVRFYEDFFRQTPDDPQLRRSMAKAWSRVGSLHTALSNHNQAQEARQEAIRRWEALHAENPDDEQIQAALAEVYAEFGGCEFWLLFNYDSAKAANERAIALWNGLEERFPDKFAYAWKRTNIEIILANDAAVRKRFDVAEQILRQVIDEQRRLWNGEAVSGKRHTSLCDALYFLALVLSEQSHRDDDVQQFCVEGVRRAEEILAAEPRSASAAGTAVMLSHLYGDFLKDHNRIAEAEEQFQRAIEVGQSLLRLNPDPLAFHSFYKLPRAQIGFATMLAREGRHAEALPLYRAAAELMRPALLLPEGPGVWNADLRNAERGLLTSLEQLARGGQLDRARRFCEELSRTGGTDPKAILSRMLAASAWDTIGDFDRSRRLLEDTVAAADRDPSTVANVQERVQSARALFFWGDWQFHRMNYEAALPIFDHVLRRNPEDSEALDHRGQIYLARGETEQALADLNEAVYHGPRYGAATFRLRALAHFRLGHYGRALSDLARAVELRSQDVRNLSAIDPAEIAACQDEPFRWQYLAWFEQAVAAAGFSSAARVERAVLQAALGHIDGVADDLAAAVADVNAKSTVWRRAAFVALRIGDEARYREFCRLLATRGLRNPDATACIDIAWPPVLLPEALDDFVPAIAAARRALTLEPATRASLVTLGGILLRAGNLDEALVHLSAAVSAPHSDEVATLYVSLLLAMTHHRLGHHAEARQWYDRADTDAPRILAEGKSPAGIPLSWIGRLTLERLRNEAMSLLNDAPTAGESGPID